MNRAERCRREKTGTVPKDSGGEQRRLLAAAVQHHCAGRLNEAAAICKKVSSATPAHPVALHMLGLIEHRAGRSESGARLIERSVAIDPSDVAAQNNLGLVLLHLKDLAGAAGRFEKSRALNPDYVEAIDNPGNVRMRSGDLEGAIGLFRIALANRPAYPDAMNNLANALSETGAFEEAVTHNNLGLALAESGAFESAAASFRDAISVGPDNAKAYRNLVLVRKFKTRDADVEMLESVLARPDLNDGQKMMIEFALTKTYDDLRESGKAFEHAVRANAGRRYERHLQPLLDALANGI